MDKRGLTSPLSVRIKNLVADSHNKHSVEVTDITQIEGRYYITTELGTLMVNDYRPIKLSKDWLLSMGFTPDLKREGVYRLYDEYTQLVFLGYKPKNASWRVAVGNIKHKRAVHVHEVQNLFHILTSKQIRFNRVLSPKSV